MKKAKLTLGLVASIVGVAAMSACNEVTAVSGVVLTFTDASGNRVDYTAEELFGTYLTSSSAASTNFSKVKEVLIRNYYQSEAMKSALANLKLEAQNSVDSIKKQAKTNAENNGTTYQSELEKLLSDHGCENIDELFEEELYRLEEEKFSTYFNTDDQVEQAKVGLSLTEDSTGSWSFTDDPYFAHSETYGRGSNGYLLEKMPYHVSHILVKLSTAASNEFAQATISESESVKLSTAVKELAGASRDGVTEVEGRFTFGDIARTLPSDDGSATSYGNLGFMADDYVQEFRLGVYAYDALYNQKNNTGSSYAESQPNPNVNYDEEQDQSLQVKDRILPSSDVDFGVNGDLVIDAFENRGIGQIPYGAAVALGDESVAKDPDLQWTVNDSTATYYARNILFNKYFNNHQIAVITPERIPYNDYLASGIVPGTSYTDDDGSSYLHFADEEGYESTSAGFYKGEFDADYAALPGFSSDTSEYLTITDKDGNAENVLTDEDGNIILAVRAGTSSYQGIHFIVVNRSALSQYGDLVTYSDPDAKGNSIAQRTEISEEYYEAHRTSEDITSLDEYYTWKVPDDKASSGAASKANPFTYYPTYDNDGVATAKSTFVNPFVAQNTTYSDYAEKVKTAVTGYNSTNDTYQFQWLIENNQITFSNDKVREIIEEYIKSKRNKSYEDREENFDDAWITYAEYLDRQDEARLLVKAGSSVGDQRLISETCAIGYNSQDARDGTGQWAKGGTCYDGK